MNRDFIWETYIEKPRELRGSLKEIILSEGLKIPNYEDYLIFKEGFVVSLIMRVQQRYD